MAHALPSSADPSLGTASCLTFCLFTSFRDELRGQIAFRLKPAEIAPETMGYVHRLSDNEVVIVLLDHEKGARMKFQSSAYSGRNHKTASFANVGCESFMGHARSVAHT